MRPAYVVHPPTPSGSSDLIESESPAWGAATAISWGAAPYVTSFRALWSERGLYVRFDAQDPSPWFTKTARDDRLWEEEVVEIFLDPAREGVNYAELEISPGNVVCDLLVRRPWPRLDSDPAWHIDGLETRVTRWRPACSGPDGWTATAFLPWTGLRSLPGDARLPPAPGDAWDFNVFRIKRPDGPSRPGGRVLLYEWSPTGGPSFHVPSAFGEMRFA